MANYIPGLLAGGVAALGLLLCAGPDLLEVAYKTEIDTSLISEVRDIRRNRIWAEEDRARDAENARLDAEYDAAQKVRQKEEDNEFNNWLTNRVVRPSIRPMPVHHYSLKARAEMLAQEQETKKGDTNNYQQTTQ
jgi:hypothetical protein